MWNVPLNTCNYTTVPLATTNAAKKKKKAKGGILSIQESVTTHYRLILMHLVKIF